MILDLFLYFAKFPQHSGVTRIASKGSSSMHEYGAMLGKLAEEPDHSLVPDIDNYVYGQSFDDLKSRIDRIAGTFLFVDYGELSTTTDRIQSMQVKERLAVTVASKLGSSHDALEQAIVSDHTLQLLASVYAHLLADIDNGDFQYADRPAVGNAEIVPFVSSELSSYGWTLMLSVNAPDALGIHEKYKSFTRRG